MNQQPTTNFGQCSIAGEWIAGQGPTWERVSPSDGQTVWQGNWASIAQMQQAIESSHCCFATWAETKLEERIAICKSFAQVVEEGKEELSLIHISEPTRPY